MFTSMPHATLPGHHSSLHRPATDPRRRGVAGEELGEWRQGEGLGVSRASANRAAIELGRSPVASGSVASFGWLLASLLGVVSCNSVLGIGEASLQCDSEPCTADIASAAGSSAGGIDTGGAASTGGGAGGMNGAGASAAGSSSPGGSNPGGSETISDPLPVSPSTPPSPAASDPAPVGEGGAASSGPAADSGAPAEPPAPALCSSGDDACGTCLCDTCESEVAVCTATPGCFEIVACARVSGCVGLACFCGTVDAFTCAAIGGANGPCVDATLAAPGSHLPTLASPSAGPASEAALALSTCSGQRCIATCQN
jgi:hypothetical protein